LRVREFFPMQRRLASKLDPHASYLYRLRLKGFNDREIAAQLLRKLSTKNYELKNVTVPFVADRKAPIG
jgi:hypothetical protein